MQNDTQINTAGKFLCFFCMNKNTKYCTLIFLGQSFRIPCEIRTLDSTSEACDLLV